MMAHSTLIIEKFCKLCDWSYQVWFNHRELFDCNPRASELQKSIGAEVFDRLNKISQEYALLQIAKLHDRSVIAGEVTLGIEFIVKYGAWDSVTAERLTELSKKLNEFADGLRMLRNKALSHNDLAAVLCDSPLGEFEQGKDIDYFSVLQEFVNLVHDKVIGGPWPFNDLVVSDVANFMTMIMITSGKKRPTRA